MTTTSELIRAQNLERANLIDRLSNANAILAYCKGFFEANKLMHATDPVKYTFEAVEAEALDRINAHLKGGLFGEQSK